MRNLKDERTKIFPSTTRGGKELPSSSALDSPSVLSKLAPPKPTTALNSDMSHAIDEATSAMHDTYDETTSVRDTTLPLGVFLDEQRARVRGMKLLKMLLLMKMLRIYHLLKKYMVLIYRLLKNHIVLITRHR